MLLLIHIEYNFWESYMSGVLERAKAAAMAAEESAKAAKAAQELLELAAQKLARTNIEPEKIQSLQNMVRSADELAKKAADAALKAKEQLTKVENAVAQAKIHISKENKESAKKELKKAGQAAGLAETFAQQAKNFEGMVNNLKVLAGAQLKQHRENRTHATTEQKPTEDVSQRSISVASTASPLFEQLKGAISGFCSAISNFASKWFYKQEQHKEERQENSGPR